MRRKLRKRKQITWHQKVAAGDRKIIDRIGFAFCDAATHKDHGQVWRNYIGTLNL